MADSCIGLAVGGDELDRLTSLPINVIHQIQDCMPIEDAARMSVLSSTLRYVWASNPKLVFDRQICQKIFGTNTVANTISTILLQHQGAIKKFSLDVLSIPSSQRSSINEWMLLLSRNGVVDLTLGNVETVNEDSSAIYELPSCVYGVALERLYLYNCIFRPPCSFTGFHGLTRLKVMQSSFELSAAASVLRMPNLVSLFVALCSGVRFLKICAPELQELLFCGCGTDPLTLSAFMDCGKLKVVGITFKGQVSRNRQDKAMKLTNVLSSWPNVRKLGFDRHFFKFFVSGTEAAERLPTTLNRLGVLRLHNFSFDQISPLLCILRSSPNLKILSFRLGLRKKGDVNYFEGIDCNTQGLNKLQILVIKNLHGTRTELYFVRFILASAPLLRKAIILVDKSVRKCRSLKINKKLMQFFRASHELKLITN